jgi:hypothetical protein
VRCIATPRFVACFFVFDCCAVSQWRGAGWLAVQAMTIQVPLGNLAFTLSFMPDNSSLKVLLLRMAWPASLLLLLC